MLGLSRHAAPFQVPSGLPVSLELCQHAYDMKHTAILLQSSMHVLEAQHRIMAGDQPMMVVIIGQPMLGTYERST